MNTKPNRPHRNPGAGWLVGCAVLLATSGLLAWSALVPPSRDRLRSIEGVVARVSDASSATKNITVLQEQILVQDGARVFQLRHEYLPQLRGVAVGDRVRVLAEQDIRGFFSIWELQRGIELLLPYEQSLARHRSSNRLVLVAAVISAACAFVLAVWHVRLRSRGVANAA